VGVGATLLKVLRQGRRNRLGLRGNRLQIGMFDRMLATADGAPEAIGLVREVDQPLGIDADARRNLALSGGAPEGENRSHGRSFR
jgi:hypothetical protein